MTSHAFSLANNPYGSAPRVYGREMAYETFGDAARRSQLHRASTKLGLQQRRESMSTNLWPPSGGGVGRCSARLAILRRRQVALAPLLGDRSNGCTNRR